MREKRKRASGDLRTRIINAALKVFGENGFERSTTKAIAQEAGIAEGTIFNYFTAKKDILFAFLEHEALSQLPEAFTDTAADDFTLIRGFLLNRLQLWKKNRAIMNLMVSEAIFDAKLANGAAERIFKPAFGHLEQYIARKVSSGAFRNVDPTAAAKGLIGMVVWYGLIQPAIEPGADPDLPRLSHTLAEIFLNGIAAEQQT